MAAPARAPRARVEGHDVTALHAGWEAARTEPGACADAAALEGLQWLPATVPGTAADVLAAAGARRWEIPSGELDGKDWWFRTSFESMAAEVGEEVVLAFDGLATVSEAYLNGHLVHAGSSMFERACADVGPHLRDGVNELAICLRALTPLLEVSRKPRARWRTRLVSDGALRFFRTMLIGRAPGFAPGPAVVGPWRPVSVERRRAVAVDELALRPRVEGSRGVLAVRARLRGLGAAAIDGAAVELAHAGGGLAARAELELDAGGEVVAAGSLAVEDVAPWWPHTHGEPSLYAVRLIVRAGGREHVIDAGRTGFRSLEGGGERLEADGVQLRVNGEPVFARGAVWTPPEAGAAGALDDGELAAALRRIRDGGFNIVRIPGVGAYERPAFHDLCDELGLLVWQDLMFANLDYPESDEAFMDGVRAEVAQLLAEVGGRPSLAVLCGSSEVAQQVAMLGLDPALAAGPLFGELLPELVSRSGVDAIYVPSAPWGGELPFHPGSGVANYYGVGAYLRPLADARASGVRFASECLAFANVPDAAALEGLGEAPGDAGWKAGVPRDEGASWDFDDVRDHYLGVVFGVDPLELRAVDPERYLELSRAVTGEVMAEVLGEWRRGGSPCGGAIIQWLRDLRPGAGWGILDHRGEPKEAWHHLRRVLAPLAVWSTDEGLSGIAVHVANDGPAPLVARLRVALYRDFEVRVEECEREIRLPAHGAASHGVEELLGRFVDVSWAYRFGPPVYDVIAFSLEAPDGRLLSQAFRMPVGRPPAREPQSQLGLSASMRAEGDAAVLTVRSRRFAYGVRVNVPGFTLAEDAFSVEPGGERSVALARAARGDAQPPSGTLGALNLAGRVPILVEEAQ